MQYVLGMIAIQVKDCEKAKIVDNDKKISESPFRMAYTRLRLIKVLKEKASTLYYVYIL